jgi:hypothetical protein
MIVTSIGRECQYHMTASVAGAGCYIWRAIAVRKKNARLTRPRHRPDQLAEARIAHRMARPAIVPTVHTDLFPTPSADDDHVHASFARPAITLYSTPQVLMPLSSPCRR